MVQTLSIGVFRLDADAQDAEDPAGAAGEDLVAGGQRGDAPSRRRCFASRRALQAVLGETWGWLPEEVPMWPDPGGRVGDSRTGPHISVAHRGEYCVVGAATACSIGVDIVRIGAAPPPFLLDKILPSQARHEVAAAPPHAQPREFALWWCRTMAAVRACGVGLEDAERSLALAPQRTATLGPHLAVAVAGLTGEPFDVRWYSGVSPRISLAGVGS